MNPFNVYGTNLLGCVFVYVFSSSAFLAAYPTSTQDLRKHIVTSAAAMPVYALLPTVFQLVIAPYTKLYSELTVWTPLHVAIFMLAVELGVYWAHRLMHTHTRLIKMHAKHHSFVTRLTSFAGFAFEPVDGIVQALPYVIVPFILPIHAGAHKLLLFFTGVWTAFIHADDVSPCVIMLGPAYHALHHRYNKTNYGHYTQLFDRLYGTLKHPVAAQVAKNC